MTCDRTRSRKTSDWVAYLGAPEDALFNLCPRFCPPPNIACFEALSDEEEHVGRRRGWRAPPHAPMPLNLLFPCRKESDTPTYRALQRVGDRSPERRAGDRRA